MDVYQYVQLFSCLFYIKTKTKTKTQQQNPGVELPHSQMKTGPKGMCSQVRSVRLGKSWSGRDCTQKDHQKRGQGRIVWRDSTLQALCEWKTQQGLIQVDAVYLVMCDPRIQCCIYQLTMGQIKKMLDLLHKTKP